MGKRVRPEPRRKRNRIFGKTVHRINSRNTRLLARGGTWL